MVKPKIRYSRGWIERFDTSFTPIRGSLDMTKPEKERRTEGNVGVQPKNLTLWEARQAVWKDRFAGLFMVRLFFCVATFGVLDVEKQERERM